MVCTLLTPALPAHLRSLVYMALQVKGGWTNEEDSLLTDLVAEFGEGNWSPIARALNEHCGKGEESGRIGKQCRERWNHHLRPDIKKVRKGACRHLTLSDWRVLLIQL